MIRNGWVANGTRAELPPSVQDDEEYDNGPKAELPQSVGDKFQKLVEKDYIKNMDSFLKKMPIITRNMPIITRNLKKVADNYQESCPAPTSYFEDDDDDLYDDKVHR